MKKFYLILLALLLTLTLCALLVACTDDDCDGDGCDGSTEQPDGSTDEPDDSADEPDGDKVGLDDLFDWNLVPAPEKPVIYLYPEQPTDVTVTLELDGALTSTYPTYGDGWRVTAHPDGALIDKNGRQYYCLFWEGVQNAEYDLTRGFSVAGKNTQAFLEDALAQLGLNEREANEFIIYWLPRMENNAYNLITFQTDRYTNGAALNVTPAPDTIIRVFMAWAALDAPVDIEPQRLTAPERDGFTVVEWGGAELK